MITKLKKANEILLVKPWIIYTLLFFIIIFAYQITYFSYPAVPGNNPDYPLGWWGWGDQGLYIKSSVAFSEANFTPSEHFYLPLYPLLGALLIDLTPLHSYWLPNLLLFLGYAAFFVMLVSRYLGIWQASAALLVGTIGFSILKLQWVIPWTSTLSAFLMMVSLYLLDQYISARRLNIKNYNSIIFNSSIFGFSIGCLVATRAIDAVVMLPTIITYAFFLLKDFFFEDDRRKPSLIAIVSGLLGGIIPLSGWLSFNYLTYGGFLSGPYFETADKLGFFFSTLDTKFYSQIIDSYSLYGEKEQDWLTQLPLFAVSLAFIPAMFVIRVALIFRVVIFSCLIHFGLYYSFSDIVPTGTFRYFNIHYFQWMMPFLLVNVLLVLQSCFSKKKNSLLALFLTTFVIFIASLTSLGHQNFPIKAELKETNHAIFYLPDKSIDYIDVPVSGGDWRTIYFSIGFSLSLDGEQLISPREYHTYPISGGMRLIFVRPIRGKMLKLELGDDVHFEEMASTLHATRVSFRFGMTEKNQGQRLVLPIHVGQDYFFGEGGNGQNYLGNGWSSGETWGRWIDGKQADLSMRLLEPFPDGVELLLEINGFIYPVDQPYVETKVTANSCFLATIKIEDQTPHSYRFRIPHNCLAQNGVLTISFQNQNHISPKKVGLNQDTRQLGLGIISMHLDGTGSLN